MGSSIFSAVVMNIVGRDKLYRTYTYRNFSVVVIIDILLVEFICNPCGLPESVLTLVGEFILMQLVNWLLFPCHQPVPFKVVVVSSSSIRAVQSDLVIQTFVDLFL